MKEKKYLLEKSVFSFRVMYQYDKILEKVNTSYNKIQIIQNPSFGVMLFLNRELQIATSDFEDYSSGYFAHIQKLEKRLSELRFLILGGGDGGLAHSLIKNGAKNVDIIDIDEQVIELCKKHYPHIWEPLITNCALTVRIGDALSYLDSCEQYDVIFYDLASDPVTSLKCDEFMSKVFKKSEAKLHKQGIFVMQAASELEIHKQKYLICMLQKYFGNICTVTKQVPSYCEPWVFMSGMKNEN